MAEVDEGFVLKKPCISDNSNAEHDSSASTFCMASRTPRAKTSTCTTSVV